jgi:type VI secretion system protein ImpM
VEAAAFLFGKLPAHGDFVRRGLDDAGEAAWDDWAASALDARRADLADDFDDAHAYAPPWRFVLAPGALSGSGWSAGALMASIDAADRRFIAALGVRGLDRGAALAHGAAIAGRAEDLGRRALAEGLDADGLRDALAPLAIGPEDAGALAFGRFLPETPSGPGIWWTMGETAAIVRLTDRLAPEDLIPAPEPAPTKAPEPNAP